MATNWTREQLVLAFELYCRTPFGRMHQHNPDIIALAGQLARTPSAVAMKLSNFASLDPAEQARGIRGLSGASQLDRTIFEEFAPQQDALFEAAVSAAQAIGIAPPPMPDEPPVDEIDEAIAIFSGPTEAERVMRVRRAQGAFRRAVLASYESQCAVCRIGLPELLCASHIIPWRHDESRRADPTNGLAMCALHDRAFDRGLISVCVNRRQASSLVDNLKHRRIPSHPTELLGYRIAIVALERMQPLASLITQPRRRRRNLVRYDRLAHLTS